MFFQSFKFSTATINLWIAMSKTLPPLHSLAYGHRHVKICLYALQSFTILCLKFIHLVSKNLASWIGLFCNLVSLKWVVMPSKSALLTVVVLPISTQRSCNTTKKPIHKSPSSIVIPYPSCVYNCHLGVNNVYCEEKNSLQKGRICNDWRSLIRHRRVTRLFPRLLRCNIGTVITKAPLAKAVGVPIVGILNNYKKSPHWSLCNYIEIIMSFGRLDYVVSNLLRCLRHYKKSGFDSTLLEINVKFKVRFNCKYFTCHTFSHVFLR